MTASTVPTPPSVVVKTKGGLHEQLNKLQHLFFLFLADVSSARKVESS